MDEDPTQKLPTFEERILAAIADLRAEMRQHFQSVDERLTALEELRGTRKLWDNLILRITSIEKLAQSINAQLGEVVRDLFVQRGRIATLEEKERERPPAA